MLRWGRGPVPLRRVTVLGLLGVVALAVGGCGFGPRYHDGDKVTYKAHVVSVSEVRNGWWDARIIFDTGDWKGRTGFFGDQDYGLARRTAQPGRRCEHERPASRPAGGWHQGSCVLHHRSTRPRDCSQHSVARHEGGSGHRRILDGGARAFPAPVWSELVWTPETGAPGIRTLGVLILGPQEGQVPALEHEGVSGTLPGVMDASSWVPE
jgi:hypothetical protein